MNQQQPSEDDRINNQRSLQQLVWAIEAAVGHFKLILVRCNYPSWRDRLIEQIRAICSVQIRILALQRSHRTLYSAIREEFGEQVLHCLMVIGLESVEDLPQILTSANQVREEFRQNFPFPLVLWINDQIHQQLMEIAPDLESWAITKNFPISVEYLVKFIQGTAEQWFSNHLSLSFDGYLSLEAELEAAQKDLLKNAQASNLSIQADLASLLGFVKQVNYQIDAALEYYQVALTLWQRHNNLERQVKILGNIAFCYYTQAVKQGDINHGYLQTTRHYVQQYIDLLAQAQNPHLIADAIVKLGDMIRDIAIGEHLPNLTSKLKSFAQQALAIHKTNNEPIGLARDYGFLAELALTEKSWQEANKLVQQALTVWSQIPQATTNISKFFDEQVENNLRANDLSLYRFILAVSQYHLGQITEAIHNLELAKQAGNPLQDLRLYLNIISYLQQLYFEQKQYLPAYEIKQHKRSVEQQFGLRAFIGPGRLGAIKQLLEESVQPTSLQENIAPEIAASGRLLDVERLIERIGRPDYKLIVIYGQSGVGKSSLVNAGLVPALKNKAIGIQDNLPIVIRVYTNWEEELARLLGIKHGDGGDLKFTASTSQLCTSVLSQLRENEKNNLRTVLIFDQFEEFFFANPEAKQKRRFFEFLGECFHILSVKVILSLRVDYLHYLLECNDLPNMQIIGNDILSNNVLYKLGNFSPCDAKSIIQRLTENTSFRLEPDLIELLVQDLAGELNEVRPIELQVVGAQLQTENITTLVEYRQRGTKQQLVKNYLDEVVYDCGTDNQHLADVLMYLLTDEKGTRPLKTLTELERDLQALVREDQQTQKQRDNKRSFNPNQKPYQETFSLSTTSPVSQKLSLVLDIFVKSGLVVLLKENPADRYQLVHDYLAAFIRQQQEPKLKDLMVELERERKQRQLGEEKLNRLLKVALFGSVAAGLILAAMVVVTWRWAIEANKQKKQAEINEINSLTNSSSVFSASGQTRDAIIEALKAVKKVQKLDNPPATTQMRVVGRLREAVYLQPQNKFQELQTWNSHSGVLRSIAFSQDGKKLASGSNDSTIKIWDVTTGKLLQTLTNDGSVVTSVVFSQDGKQLVSGSDDTTIKIWDVTTGKVLQTLTGHKDVVHSVTLSLDGQRLASGSGDRTIKIWDISTGKVLQTLTGHNDFINSVAFSRDGQRLASGSDDRTIKIWDVSTGKILQTLTGHKDAVTSVVFNPDGKQLVSGSGDNSLKIWDVSTGKLLQTLTGHRSPVTSVVFSQDGLQLVSGSGDSTIKIWDVITGKVLQTLTGHRSRVTSVALSLDGLKLVSVSDDSIIKLWNLTIGKFVQTLTGHDDLINTIAYSPDGQKLVSGSFDKTIKIWDVSTSKVLFTLIGHDGVVTTVALSQDGQKLASGSDDKTIKIWDVSTGKLLQTLSGHYGPVTSIALSPDGQKLVSGSDDRTIKIWDVSTGKLLQTLSGHNGAVTTIALSQDGQKLVSGSGDTTIKIWDMTSGKLLQTLSDHRDLVRSVALSPDGQKLVSGSFDNTIKIWDVSTGKVLKTLTGHYSGVNTVAFSPDGKQLVSGSADNSIKIWDVSTGKVLQTLASNYNSSFLSVVFSPDGQQLASGNGDYTIIIWNFNLNQLVKDGCNLINNYLIFHPETLAQLDLCQSPSVLVQAATVLVIQGENLAQMRDVDGAETKFRQAQEWDTNLQLDPEGKAKDLAQQEKPPKGTNRMGGRRHRREPGDSRFREEDPLMQRPGEF